MGQQDKDQSDTSEKQWTSLGLGECLVGLEPQDGGPATHWGHSGDSIFPSLYHLVPALLMLKVERRQGTSLLYIVPEVQAWAKVDLQD